MGESMKHIYLSGPMKGYPDRNYPLFDRVAAELRGLGHDVYSPADFPHEQSVFPIRRAFAEYCRYICETADAIVLLPGWEKSLGVAAELALAKNCGLEVIEYRLGEVVPESLRRDAELARYRQALAPFAAEARQWAGRDLIRDDARPGIAEPGSRKVLTDAEYTFGDLRRALALIEGEPCT